MQKDILVNQIQSELSEVANAISSGQYGQAAMDLLKKNNKT